MPEPTIRRTMISVDDINSRYYSLNPQRTISYMGYQYRIDFDTHDADVAYARRQLELARRNFSYGYLTESQLEDFAERFTFEVSRYHLIDEDEKICGEYFNDTRQVNIHLARIMVNNRVYYLNQENNWLFTYANSCVGQLRYSENGEPEIVSVDV